MMICHLSYLLYCVSIVFEQDYLCPVSKFFILKHNMQYVLFITSKHPEECTPIK